MQESARRLSAVFFADIVGFTTLTAVDENAAIQMVDLLQRLSYQIIEHTHRGRVVKFIGDATLAEFASADAAVRAALSLQHEYRASAEAMGATGLLRIAVHLGEVLAAPDGDIYGDGVNVASKLEEHTRAGNVTVSEDVWRQLRTRRAFTFKALPPLLLKGIDGSVGVYDVTTGVEEPESNAVPSGFGQDRRRTPRMAAAGSAWRPRPTFVMAAGLASMVIGLGLFKMPGSKAPIAEADAKNRAPVEATKDTVVPPQPLEAEPRKASVLSGRGRSTEPESKPRTVSPPSQNDLTSVLDDFTRSLARGDTRRMRELFPNADASSLKMPEEVAVGAGTSGEIASLQFSKIENGVASVNLVLAFKSSQSSVKTPLPYRAQLVKDGNRWLIQSFARR